MSSSDDDLPDVSFGVGKDDIKSSIKAPSLKIDVDYEIRQSLRRRETRRQIYAEEQKRLEAELPPVPKCNVLKEPKINAFPAQRPIFCLPQSQKCFNAESLSLKESCPDDYLVLGSSNWIEFFLWIRVKIQNSSSDDCRRSILLYLWCMQSVHSDAFVVLKCHDILLEFNDVWRLKWDEVILLFWNWGSSVEDFVTDTDVKGICAPLVNSSLVSPYNVELAINVLKEQLRLGDLQGNTKFQKTIFVLLSLLGLDSNYSSSIYVVQSCLESFEAFAFSQEPSWISVHSQSLLSVEQNHARIAFLAQCILPASVRRCLSFAFCQHMMSVRCTYVEKPEASHLCDFLQKNMKQMLKLDSYEIHSVMTLVDCIVADNITAESDKDARSGLLKWLRDFSQGLRLGAKEEIDVDATVVSELLSRLQAEWEESWRDLSECQEYFSDHSEDELSDSSDGL